MNGRVFLCACASFLMTAVAARPQQKPLTRTFSVGDTHRYRVVLTLRSELVGHRAVESNGKSYLQSFSCSAAAGLGWTATRRVLEVAEDGGATLEESLDQFSRPEEESSSTAGCDDAEKLSRALGEALSGWTRIAPLVLRYVESPSGQLRELNSGVPALDESPPPLLTLWLLRALRPTASLPDRPLRFREPWREPRAVRLENWTDVRGAEVGEWLEVIGSLEPDVRLHVVQQISGTVIGGPDKPGENPHRFGPREVDGNRREAANAQGRFHAESLSTLSLADGRLLAATRSATREITWVWNPVPGLPEPPRFRGILAVQVHIDECHENCAPSGGERPARPRRP